MLCMRLQLASSRLGTVQKVLHLKPYIVGTTYRQTFAVLPAASKTLVQTYKAAHQVTLVSWLRQSSRQLAGIARTRKLLPFEVDSRVPQDVLIYSYKNDRLYKLLTIFGVVQFLFWVNIAFFTYSTPALADKQGRSLFGEDTWWSMIARLQSKYKSQLAVVCMVFANLVLLFTTVYPQRSIHKLVLLKGGENIRVTTYHHFGNTRSFELPLSQVSSIHSRAVKGSSMSLKLKGRWFYYLLDKRDGKFHNTRLFDYAVGLKRDLKS